MKILDVNIPGREYKILIEHGLLKKCGSLVRDIFKGGRIAIVTDSNVGPLYAKIVINELLNNGYQTKLITIPAGEKSKSTEMLTKLYNEMLEFGLTRADLIIALGGGVVGDLTGYAAASLLRGIPYLQIPTTLLAQVDSSVGGKVAIDLPQGKNLVGAFNQPKAVIIDPNCLRTLEPRVLSDGMAEVIKYGAINDEKLFELLESIDNRKDLFANISEIIYNCCNIKRQVVENDEFDTGGRMILNFGHTFGHAIEKQFNFETYTHGEAVAAGMVMACMYGEKVGLTKPGTSNRIRNIIRNYNLPDKIALNLSELSGAINVDKKGEGNFINLILINDIGDVMINKTDKDDFINAFSELEI